MAKNGFNGWTLPLIVTIVLSVLAAAQVSAYFRGGTEAKMENAYKRLEKVEVRTDDHDRKITILETRQTAIYEGVKRIEAKLE